MLNTATLEMAKQEAAKGGFVVTPDDINTERDMTLATLFGEAKKEDYSQLALDQLLARGISSKPEF